MLGWWFASFCLALPCCFFKGNLDALDWIGLDWELESVGAGAGAGDSGDGDGELVFVYIYNR